MILNLTAAWSDPLYFHYGLVIQTRSEEPIYAHWATDTAANSIWKMVGGVAVTVADLAMPSGLSDGVLIRKGETFIIGHVEGQHLRLRAGGVSGFAQVYLGQWQLGGGD